MGLFKRVALAGALGAIAAPAAFAGTASAAFPDFSDCPREIVSYCIDVRSEDGGALTINRTTLPIRQGTLEIRGGIDQFLAGEPTFVPARGTDGVFGAPTRVPGGLLGIELPVPSNTVKATIELAGDPSEVSHDAETNALALPIKIRLSNRLIGANCHIGTDANPIRLDLTTGTTAPPAPNAPIAGDPGTGVYDEATNVLTYTGTVEVDNAFAVPGASSCGWSPDGVLVNRLIDLRLRLPSAAGRNALRLPVTIALGANA